MGWRFCSHTEDTAWDLAGVFFLEIRCTYRLQSIIFEEEREFRRIKWCIEPGVIKQFMVYLSHRWPAIKWQQFTWNLNETCISVSWLYLHSIKEIQDNVNRYVVKSSIPILQSQSSKLIPIFSLIFILYFICYMVCVYKDTFCKQNSFIFKYS